MHTDWKNLGVKTVFTNGVFDILHKGHVTLLASAADCGEKLIVGINADTSVKLLGKGDERPITGEYDRALLIAALGCVDAVVIFTEPTPLKVIQKIQPDVLIKGGDYSAEQQDKTAKDYIVGSDLQRDGSRQTIVIPIVRGYATTATLLKILNG